MYETKFLPLLKKCFLTALCIVLVCALLSGMTFSPSKTEGKAVQTSAQTDCPPSPSVQTPPAVTPTLASEPIIKDPEETIIAEPEEDPNPYAELDLTAAEKELLACMAYSEAGNQELVGQIAVVQVALNRMLHPNFPDTISDVLLAPHQFCVGSYYGEQQMEAVEAALAGDSALDLNTDVVFFSTGSLTYGSYYKTIGAHVFRTYM